MDMRGGVLPERAYSDQPQSQLLENFDRLLAVDVWKIDMATAQVMMGDRARLLHHLPANDRPVGLGEYLSTYEVADARRVAKLIDQAIDRASPFFYVAALNSKPRDMILGIGEPQGDRISGIFLAPRYPMVAHSS